jgi:AcrR family transcriptional regulator
MRSLAGEARAARHAAVLDEATVEFNRVGVAGASLAAIARRVGLTRAGIYNYCADRVDLVRQCYLRACDLTQADLTRAAAGGGRGLDKVTTFIRLAVEPGRPPVAVLSELAFLPEASRHEVQAARTRNVETLKALVGQGVEDGSIRPCDADLACQTIFGMLSWAPLGRAWTDNDDDTFAIRMAAATPVLIIDGVASEGATIPPMRLHIADVIAPSEGSEKDQRLEALTRAGSRLFNRRGIDGVSLDDVAAEVGATKGLVYHYFDSKPAFVAHCYDRAFDLYDQIMSVAETGGNGLECSLLALGLNVEAQIEDLHPLSLTTGLETFSEAARQRFSIRTNSLAARSVELSRRGVKDGSLRPFDLEPVVLASAGAFSHLSKWLPPGDNRPASEISGEVGRLFLLGLRQV